jgi:hypothetical protein
MVGLGNQPPEEGLAAKATLNPRESSNAVAMRSSDPQRAQEMIDNADAYMKGSPDASQPMEEVGNRLVKAQSDLQNMRSEAGKALGEIRKEMGTAAMPIDTADVADTMRSSLEEKGVEFTESANGGQKLDFGNSQIPDSDQGYIEKMYQKLANGDLTEKQLSDLTVKWGRELYPVNGKPPAFTDAATAFEKMSRTEAQKAITAQIPEMGPALEKYSSVMDNLKALTKVIGPEGENATQFVRLVNGANQAKYGQILSDLEDFSAKNGLGYDNLLNEAKFAGDLQNMSGINNPYDFAGGIQRAQGFTTKEGLMKKAGQALIGSPMDNVAKIIQFAEQSGDPALTRFANFLETDVTPYIQKTMGAIGEVAGNKSGSAMMPTSALPNPLEPTDNLQDLGMKANGDQLGLRKVGAPGIEPKTPGEAEALGDEDTGSQLIGNGEKTANLKGPKLSQNDIRSNFNLDPIKPNAKVLPQDKLESLLDDASEKSNIPTLKDDALSSGIKFTSKKDVNDFVQQSLQGGFSTRLPKT